MADPTRPVEPDWARTIGDLGIRTVPAQQRVAKAGTANEKPFVILKGLEGGEGVQYLDEAFDRPHHPAGTFAFDDVESLLAYWEKYKTPSSLMFASLEPAAFTAVFNEHVPVSATANPAPVADWRDHRATLILRHSKEWTRWMAANGPEKAFPDPVLFADWLQEAMPDVITPPSGQLAEIALSMKLSEAVNWKKVAILANGQIQMQYDNLVEGSATTSGGEVKIPDVFVLSVPVWHGLGAKLYPVRARLRYRRSGAGVKIWYELDRPHKVVELAFKDLYEAVKEKCGGVLLGKA